MAKVLKTNVSKTIIGLDNGSIEEVDTASLDFIPQVDDELEVYKTGDEIIVRKCNKEQFYHNGRRVNKLVYALLAIFLVSFGIHKFYAGRMVGIVYILFFWTCIPGLIGFIEGIAALVKEADSDGNIYL